MTKLFITAVIVILGTVHQAQGAFIYTPPDSGSEGIHSFTGTISGSFHDANTDVINFHTGEGFHILDAWLWCEDSDVILFDLWDFATDLEHNLMELLTLVSDNSWAGMDLRPDALFHTVEFGIAPFVYMADDPDLELTSHYSIQFLVGAVPDAPIPTPALAVMFATGLMGLRRFWRVPSADGLR